MNHLKIESPRIRSEGLFFTEKILKKVKLFFKNPLTKYHFYGIICTERRTQGMAKKPNKKPTTYEKVELILKAATAIAALISAIKWW